MAPNSILSCIAITASLALTPSVSTFAQSAPDGPITSLPYSPSLDLTSMDKTAEACMDFYRYACGGWEQKNPIPADQSSWSVYGKLHDENLHFLWGLLNEVSAAP